MQLFFMHQEVCETTQLHEISVKQIHYIQIIQEHAEQLFQKLGIATIARCR